MKPIGARVLILPDKPEEKIGGIIVPKSAQGAPQTGKIVETGNGTEDEPMPVVPGDRVLFSANAGFPVTENDVEYLLVRTGDILAAL